MGFFWATIASIKGFIAKEEGAAIAIAHNSSVKEVALVKVKAKTVEVKVAEKHAGKKAVEVKLGKGVHKEAAKAVAKPTKPVKGGKPEKVPEKVEVHPKGKAPAAVKAHPPAKK